MDRELLSYGFSFTDVSPAFYIINSCAITAKAEREVRQHIYQTLKRYPHTTIIVTGCSATEWMNSDVQPPERTHFLSNEHKRNIVPYILTLLKEPVLASSFAPPCRGEVTDKFMQSGRLTIKIQDGCTRFCSYCIVPQLRGTPTSSSIASIVQEIQGSSFPLDSIKEVVLTAINTEYFGKESGQTIMDLVDAICKETTVPRISFGSINPWSITDDFLSWYKHNSQNSRLVHFFHIPIQSGSDSVLTRMNRQYTTQELFKKITAIKAINPLAFIGTDVIVGFPGETDVEFEETRKFLVNSSIDRFHIFRFSLRPHTAAETMIQMLGEPTPAEKATRSQTLLSIGETHLTQFMQNNISRTTSALCLEPYKDGLQEALLDNQLPVYIQTDPLPAGTIVSIEITEMKNGRLRGRIKNAECRMHNYKLQITNY